RRRTKRLDRFPPGLEAPAIAAVETLIGPGMASRIAVTGTVCPRKSCRPAICSRIFRIVSMCVGQLCVGRPLRPGRP
ncbi:MAG: hypothetical protein LBI87_08995, partial [Candidatus Accumulibacter sp.]|nr:hypothetical protein [Accumulibacter sp.]